jgi:hypothetical protein
MSYPRYSKPVAVLSAVSSEYGGNEESRTPNPFTGTRSPGVPLTVRAPFQILAVRARFEHASVLPEPRLSGSVRCHSVISPCPRQDLNLRRAVAHQPLRLACLPVPPLGQNWSGWVNSNHHTASSEDARFAILRTAGKIWCMREDSNLQRSLWEFGFTDRRDPPPSPPMHGPPDRIRTCI